MSQFILMYQHSNSQEPEQSCWYMDNAQVTPDDWRNMIQQIWDGRPSGKDDEELLQYVEFKLRQYGWKRVFHSGSASIDAGRDLVS